MSIRLDFQDLLELMLKRELSGAIICNSWWGKLKDSIRSLLLTIVGDSERSVELDRVVKAGDRGATKIAKAELASFQF